MKWLSYTKRAASVQQLSKAILDRKGLWQSRVPLSAYEKQKCHKIIHTASLSAAGVGAGFAQLPISDATLLLPIQTAMILSIAKVFHYNLKDGAAKTMATQFLVRQAGQYVTRFLVGKIPIAGNILNASTAALLTEAYGWAIAQEFAQERYRGAQHS